MKILFLVGNLDLAGGTERVASIIANGFVEAGHEVIIVSSQGGENPFFPLAPSIKTCSLFNTVGRTLWRAPSLIWRIRRVVQRVNPDVLIVVESMLTLFTIPAVMGVPVKHICWEHFNFRSDLGRKGRRLARKLAVRYCDVVVTLTERDRYYWLEGTNGTAEIITIPNPSPFPVQSPEVIQTTENIVLAVGRLVPQKGFDLLLKAWAQISCNAPGWHLRIVGDGQDREMLVDLAKTLQITDTVVFAGSTSNVEQHYREAAVYCLSSRFEGFGMVLVEAMSFGLPIVSYDCDTGPAEILKDVGVLVKAEDISALGDALLNTMRNRSGRLKMSALGRSRAEFYQVESIMNHWLLLIDPTRCSQ